MPDFSTLLALTQEHASNLALDIELAQNRESHIRMTTRLNEVLAIIREIRNIENGV